MKGNKNPPKTKELHHFKSVLHYWHRVKKTTFFSHKTNRREQQKNNWFSPFEHPGLEAPPTTAPPPAPLKSTAWRRTPPHAPNSPIPPPLQNKNLCNAKKTVGFVFLLLFCNYFFSTVIFFLQNLDVFLEKQKQKNNRSSSSCWLVSLPPSLYPSPLPLPLRSWVGWAGRRQWGGWWAGS